jgi:hypothetical protein
MIIENPHELFVLLLSNVRQGAERATQMFQDFSKVAQNADVKEALDARVFASQRVVEKLDECFRLIGEQPVKLGGRLRRGFPQRAGRDQVSDREGSLRIGQGQSVGSSAHW